MRLAEPQKSDEKAQRIRAKGLNGYKELDGILYHQGLQFILKVIQTEFINQHHYKSPAEHFGINKTKDLVGRKYYWPSLQRDIEAYIKGYNIYLGLKAVKHKSYGNLQSLPIPTY